MKASKKLKKTFVLQMSLIRIETSSPHTEGKQVDAIP